MNIAIVLSGGVGTRMGLSTPKQYIEVKGQPILAYTLDTLQKHLDIDRIQIVANKEWYKEIEKWVGDKFAGFSEPGKNRQLSILNALNDIMGYAKDSDNVLVQDAVRPLTSSETIHSCLEGLKAHDGVMPALPMKDTVYIGENGQIESLLDRSKVIAGQAPEAFRLGSYYQANLALLPDRILEINGSAEPAILAGIDVGYISGDEDNFKITTRNDLLRFEQIISQKDACFSETK